MKTLSVALTALAAGSLAVTMAFAPAGYAAEEKAKAPATMAKPVEKPAQQQADQNTQDQMAERRKRIAEEATAAIRETQDALKALDQAKKTEALAALERATGKLELILAREPKLALAPMGVSTVTYNVIADIEAVKAARKEAERLLDDGRLQQARHLIRDLASENVISVTNIPLATYPTAIKTAVKLVDENKIDEAKHVLQSALNTLVVTDTIVPLPVVSAQEVLKNAEQLTEKKDRTAEENTKLKDLLKKARTDLEFAQALGYGTEKDFKELYDQVSEIEKKTEGGKSGTGFFARVKSSLSSLEKLSQTASSKDSPAQASNK
jgi:hypothetical protein